MRLSRPIAPYLAALPTVLLLATLVALPAAAAPRFAVVNLSGRNTPASVVAEIEREIVRLRPGDVPITDAAMRKLLTTGEQPLEAVIRLIGEAEERRQAGDCAGAIPLLTEAETLALTALGFNDERDPLKRLYVLGVVCEDVLGRAEQRTSFARRLRGLVALPPEGLPQELWDAHVAGALAGTPTVELQIDSEPANAQVSVNFHGDGVTPRTLKVPPGEVLVEVQKEGYKKGFRRLEARDTPLRTVFRLIDLRHDRIELVAAALRVLGQEELDGRPRTLSQLAQWVRADRLILVRTTGERVRLWQYDAERGALAREVIDSGYDADTGRVDALAALTTPKRPPNRVAGVLAPVGRRDDVPSLKEAPDDDKTDGLGASFAERPRPRAVRPKSKAPWWGWLIAAAVAGGIAAVVLTDRESPSSTLDVTATYDPRQ